MSMNMPMPPQGILPSTIGTDPYASFIFKDIPLSVFRDYISEDYLNSSQFQDNVSLYDSLNKLYQAMTPMDSSSGTFSVYSEVLTDALANKYAGTYPTTVTSIDDIRRVSVEVLGKQEILASILRVTTTEKNLKFIGYSPMPVTVLSVPEGSNATMVMNAFNQYKENFFQSYQPMDMVSDNLYVNIKRSLNSTTNPSIVNTNSTMNTDFLKAISSVTTSIRLDQLQDSKPVIIDNPTIIKKELFNDYTAMIELFVAKYNYTNIKIFDINEEEADGIKTMIKRKFIQGVEQGNELDPSIMDNSVTGLKLNPATVIEFLRGNNVMQEYVLVKE
jgi:hypothetical protein